MKKNSLYLVLLISLLFTQCQKKDDIKNPDTNAEPEANEKPLDEETSFAMSMLSSNAKTASTVYTPCDGVVVMVDTLPLTQTDKKTIRLTFDAMVECAQNGSTIKKQGFIEFQLTTGNYWDEPGAEITKTFANYKEYRRCATCLNGTELVAFNGIITITNVTGGLISDLTASHAPIIHQLNATNMTLTYDDGHRRTQNITETLTGKVLSDGSYEFSISGNGSHNGINNVAMWGVNRLGSNYYMVYNSPKIYNTCTGPGTGKTVSGEAFFQKGSDKIIETYGVNKNGILVNNCSTYGFKRVTTKGNGTVTTETIKY